MATASELPININASATQMAQEIFGGGISIVNATYFGDNQSSGIYSNGDAVSPFLTPSNTGVIFSTGRVRDVTNSSGDPNTSSGTSRNTGGIDNDSRFNTLAGRSTYDAAILEVDFIPTTNVISMQFTFGSDEYPEYVGTIFNDVVGIWINNVEVASPIFDTANVSTLNGGANETLYVDNTGDDYNTEMDGFTVTLTVVIPVNIGVENTIRLGIADVADNAYDSVMLIAGNSVQGEVLAQDDAITVSEGQTALIDVLANDTGAMFVTHINGQPISPLGSVTLSSGHVVTLNASGLLSVQPPASLVNLTDDDVINFSYTADDGSGITDSAFITITTIPCFTRGTRIRTIDGDVKVEDLSVGQMVETRDCGPQPIRWIGRRRVAARGRFAPIVIEAGTLGYHRRLKLSPQHRVLITGVMAELLFGEHEVLVAAKELVNDCSIRVEEGGEVEYLHLLFDDHQIIWSEGLQTESFLPGPMTMGGMDEALQQEIVDLFPELDPATGDGYGGPARVVLKSYEARALLGAMA